MRTSRAGWRPPIAPVTTPSAAGAAALPPHDRARVVHVPVLPPLLLAMYPGSSLQAPAPRALPGAGCGVLPPVDSRFGVRVARSNGPSGCALVSDSSAGLSGTRTSRFAERHVLVVDDDP